MPYISRRHIRRFFNADLPVFAQSEMVVGDTTYKQGEEFPWKELGLDERAIHTLFRTRKVSHHQEGDILAGNPVDPEASTDPNDADDSDEPTDLTPDIPEEEDEEEEEEEVEEEEVEEEEKDDEE